MCTLLCGVCVEIDAILHALCVKSYAVEIGGKTKKILITLILIVGCGATLFSQKVATLMELQKPTSIAVNDDYLYVNERTTIFIYSRKDYKFIKKFGRAGEGPREFLRFAAVIPQKDNLLINSMGKISYFTNEGEYISETKAKGGGLNFLFWPVGDGYVGISLTTEDNVGYEVVNLYDKELNKTKEVYRLKSDNQVGTARKYLFPPRTVHYLTQDDKIYCSGKPGFIIDVFDKRGDKIFSIEEKEYEPRKLTKQDEKEYMEWLVNRSKDPSFKQMIKIKPYYPEIIKLMIDNNYLYAITWKFQGNEFETSVYDMNGKFVKKIFLPFAMQDLLNAYPIGINNGVIFRLIENDEEEWELFITDVSI